MANLPRNLEQLVVSLLDSPDNSKPLPKIKPTRKGLILRLLHLQAYIVGGNDDEIDEGTANEVNYLLNQITLVIEQKNDAPQPA